MWKLLASGLAINISLSTIVYATDHLPLPFACEAALTRTPLQKAKLLVPRFARRWLRDLVPASRPLILDALHARLRELLPEDFANQTMSATSKLDRHSIFSQQPSGKSFKYAVLSYYESRQLLHEILDVTELEHGKNSVEAGFAHYSLALYYFTAADLESAIERKDVNFTLGDYGFNGFDSSGLAHARDAVRILQKVKSPYVVAARLHLIKHLVRASRALGRTHIYSTGGYPVPPEAGYSEHEQEAESEIKTLFATYMQEDLTSNAKTWIFLNASYQRTALDKLKAEMSERATGESYANVRLDFNLEEQWRSRYETLLNVAVRQRTLLPSLLKEGRDGVLFAVVNSLRWSYQNLRNAPLFDPKKDKDVYSLELMFNSKTLPTALEFIKKLEALGFEVPPATSEWRAIGSD